MPSAKMERSFSMREVKRQFQYRKPIQPFISSTFQDFQAEREVLVKKVFPHLDALCRQRGTYCSPLDLRWGINDNQVSSRQIIRLCLENVNRCSPFFICLLGERYGSSRAVDAPELPATYGDLPEDAGWLDQNIMVAASSGFDWLLQPTYQKISITEMEIIQALTIAEAEHSYFYYRQPDHVEDLFRDLPPEERKERLVPFLSESPHHKSKLDKLKNKLVKEGLQIRYYKTPCELAGLVLADWTGVIDLLYPPLENIVYDIYTERFREWMAHEAYAETRRRNYIKTVSISQFMADQTEFAEAVAGCQVDVVPLETEATVNRRGMSPHKRSHALSDKPILAIVGERGCGKTALMANWLKEFTEERPDIKVFSHFIGCSALSIDVAALIRRCVQVLRKEHNLQSLGESDLGVVNITHLYEAFLAALRLGPCVLVIDGIDGLGDSDKAKAKQIKQLNWLPMPLPAHCKVILTTVKSDMTYVELVDRPDVRVTHIPVLGDTHARRQVIEENLASHGKCLDEQQLERIVNCKLSDRALFLSVLANELRVFGVYSDLDHHLDWYLSAASIRDLWVRIIRRWLTDYSWTAEGGPCQVDAAEAAFELSGWVADALRLIAVARHGLTQCEVLDVLEKLGYTGTTLVRSFNWALFRSAAQDALFEGTNGLLRIVQEYFRDAVEHALLGAVTPDQPPSSHTEAPQPTMPIVFFDKAKKDPDRRAFHEHLSDHFLHMEHCERRTQELPYQLMMCGNLEALSEVLTEPRLFQEMYGDHPACASRLELISYWDRLSHEGYNPDHYLRDMAERAYHQSKSYAEGTPAEDTENTVDTVHLAEDSEITTEEDTVKDPLTPEGSINLSDAGLPSPVPRIRVSIGEVSRDGSDIDSADAAASGSLSCRSMLTVSSEADSEASDPPQIRRTISINQGVPMKYLEQATLDKSVGFFMAQLGHFRHSESLLLRAHSTVKEHFPLCETEQLFLCDLEECIADNYLYQLITDKASHWYNRSLYTLQELCSESIEKEPDRQLVEIEGRLLDKLGTMGSRSGDHDEAEVKLQRAEECMVRAGSLPGKASVRHHIGLLWSQRQQYDKAEPYFRQAVCLSEKWYGRDHPAVAEVLNDLAGLLGNPRNKLNSDCGEAKTLYRRTLCIREKCLGPDHLLVATTLFHLGKLLQQESNSAAMAEALSMLKRALDIRTTKLGPDHKLTLAIRRVLSRLETSIQARATNNQSEHRLGEGSFSSLSWHEFDLVRLQESEKHKTARNGKKKANRKKSNELKHIRPGSINQVNKTRWTSPPVDFFDKLDRKYYKDIDNNNIAINSSQVYRPPHRRLQTSVTGTVAVVSTETARTKSTDDGAVTVSLDTHQMAEEAPPHLLPCSHHRTTPLIPQCWKPRVPTTARPSTAPMGSVASGSLDDRLHDSVTKDNRDRNPDNRVQSHRLPQANSTKDTPHVKSWTAHSALSFTQSLTKLEEPSRTEINSPETKDNYLRETWEYQDIPAYIDSYARSFSPSSSRLDSTNSKQVTSRYGKKWTPTSTAVSHPGLQNLIERRRLLHSAPTKQSGRKPESPQRSQSALTRYSTVGISPRRSSPNGQPGAVVAVSHVSQERHKSQCYVPGPHTLDPHNVYSINGPNSSVDSLMGPPPCPRDTQNVIHHRSAWYYAPGRKPSERERATRVRWGPTTRMLTSPAGDTTAAADDMAASTCGSDLARTWPSPSRSTTPLSYGKHAPASPSKARTTISVPIFKGVRIYQK